MKNINCYGDENKKRLVQKYYLKPMLYLGLLPNQEKQGCCGKLTDRYYIFKATDKKSKKEHSFYAGKHCAEGILNLIKAKPLSFFDPLKSINNLGSGEGDNTNENYSNTVKKKLHPVNSELIHAIYIISMAWNYPPPVSILNIVDYTKNLDELTINERGVCWINKNLVHDDKNRTLSKIYSDLKDQNPLLKELDFDNLIKYMSEQHPNETNRY